MTTEEWWRLNRLSEDAIKKGLTGEGFWPLCQTACEIRDERDTDARDELAYAIDVDEMTP